MSRNPYLLDESACISFSGGRSSGYMLHQILDAHDGELPENVIVCFANTGKEMPETLDFVANCAAHWDVKIMWLELGAYEQDGLHESGRHAGKPKWRKETHIVNYHTASRNGEPFERLIKARNYLPNPTARFCTQELKVQRIAEVADMYLGRPWMNVLGIRGDEPHRVARLKSRREGHERYLPMAEDGVTRDDVAAFWQEQPFDLQLPNNNGTTDWGNCDLCFLKGTEKRKSIMRLRPDLADWWIEQENNVTTEESTAKFRADAPDYATLRLIATDNQELPFIDETIPCYCGD